MRNNSTVWLHALGLDPSHPDVWRRAFFQLAHLHQGVGHLAWNRERSNRNSATWRNEDDLLLIHEMIRLRDQSLTEEKTIAILATGQKTRELFPYRKQKQRHDPILSENDRRIAALRARWQKIKRSGKRGLAEPVLGESAEAKDSFGRSLALLDQMMLFPEVEVKIENGKKDVVL
jgi:hypothetical protein